MSDTMNYVVTFVAGFFCGVFRKQIATKMKELWKNYQANQAKIRAARKKAVEESQYKSPIKQS